MVAVSLLCRQLDQVLPVQPGREVTTGQGRRAAPGKGEVGRRCRGLLPSMSRSTHRGRLRPATVSASLGGSGAIADKIEPIDNKIEQAMDLVKSHLLLAVREEVDVLKASITKLVEKISVLERENEVLKANATPEVLAQLDTQPSQAPSPAPTPAPPVPPPASSTAAASATAAAVQQQQPPAPGH